MGYAASFVRASHCGLDLELDDDDNISSVGYELDKLTHALDEYLDERAPVVREGSFLELDGEGERFGDAAAAETASRSIARCQRVPRDRS